MYRASLISLLIVLSVGTVQAQGRGSNWSFMLGGQAAYGFASEPEARTGITNNYLSGFSPSYNAGAVVSASYRLTSSFSLSATVGSDVHRFSYDLVSPPTFGEVNGRTVPGRNLTAYKGLGVSGFAELGASIQLANTAWSPCLLFRVATRNWIMEHSNAEGAYAAGYQELAGREDAKYQLHVGAGFGVSPFSKSNQISLVYLRTLEPYEPLHNLLVLRQTFLLSSGRNKVTCPTF